MSQHSFPHKQLKSPTIGLGLAALGRPGYINLGHAQDLQQNYSVEVMEALAHRVLDTAYQNGVRYFDAARSYGKAEEFLGSWIRKRQFKRGDLVVGSKWGYTYTADWQVQAEHHEIKEHSTAVLNRQWPLSQQLLPHLQLYQIHSATLKSGVLDNVKVLNRLAELKQTGMLIGLSISGDRQADVLARALDVEIDGAHLFDSVQATFNLLARDIEVQLELARQAGMIVIIKEALANGRLTSRNQNEAFSTKRNILERMAEEKKVGMDAIALAFVLQQPFASIVLSGAATEEQLTANLKALNVKLSEEEKGQLASLRMPEEAYWSERSRLAWN